MRNALVQTSGTIQTVVRFLSTVLILSLTQLAASNVLDGFESPSYVRSVHNLSVPPNEKHPEKLLPIVRGAPEGVYISVGTERGFIGASLTPSATHLVLVDVDPAVVRYNRINIALLAASRSRADYLRLRAAGEFAWEGLALNEADRGFWRSSVRHKEFEDFLREPGGQEEFRNANYLFDGDQFKKLQAMAKAGRIGAMQLNLGAEDQMKALADHLARQKITLSVLDISNAWNYDLRSIRGVPPYLSGLRSIAVPASRVVATDERGGRWRYYGTIFERFGETLPLDSHAPRYIQVAGDLVESCEGFSGSLF